MRVIDFRLRPPMGGFLDMVMYANIERSAAMAGKLGLRLAPSALSRSIDTLLDEMDQARVEKAVVPARVSPVLGTVENDDVADIAGRYPDRFIGFAAVDPTIWKNAIAEIKRMREKGLKGVVIEPGLLANPMHIDDARIYPVYAFCEERDIPVLLMAGGNAGPDCTYTSPEHVDRVARDFPTLKLISGHGNWPWASQIIHICYRRPNIYLSPDMYLYNGMPGWREYIDAANGFMSERFLFATAYPVMPLQGTIDSFLALGVKESVIDRVMYANAANLLGIR